MKADISPAKKYYRHDFFINRELPLSILHMDRTIEYPLHSHEFCELVLIYSGVGTHFCDEKVSEVRPGDVLFIPIGKEHSYSNIDSLSYVNIVFDESLVERDLLCTDVFLHIHLSEFEMSGLLDMVKRMDKEIYRKMPRFDLYCRSLFTIFLIGINRAVGQSVQPGDTDAGSRVKNVTRIVTDNLSNGYTLIKLAEMAHMSPRHFSRVFRNLYGTTVFHYINQSRIKESLELLAGTEMTVTQIAFLVGFDDSSYYSVMFRKIMGMSPSEFRSKGGDPPEDWKKNRQYSIIHNSQEINLTKN